MATSSLEDESDKLKLLSHPEDQGAVNGDRVTFAVVAEGCEQLSYEWCKDGKQLDCQSPTLTIESFLPAKDKGNYKCIVTGAFDDTVIIANSNTGQLKDLSSELDRARSFQKPLTICFLGRIGKGKSTLINSLFGKIVVPECDSVYPGSQKIHTNTYHMNGIEIIMVDTPGFVTTADNPKSMADTMKEIAEKIPGHNVDLVIYCVRMTERLDGMEDQIAMQLTKTYGEKIWTHMMFVLTFANEVNPSRSCNDLNGVAHFKKRLSEMTDAIRKGMLGKSAGVSEAIADKVPVVPVGRPQRLKEGLTVDELPDECNWLSNFWCQVLQRIHEPVKAPCNLHPFVKANDHRFLDQTIKT